MYAIDLFETPGTPEQDPRPQSAYVPVNPEKPGSRNRALGNANLAILMKAINNVDMNNRPAPLPAKISFLDGREYTIEPKYYPAIIGYYRNINDVERVNFIYRTLVSYNKTIKFLNTLSQGSLFEREEEKKSSKYKDVAVQRAMRQAAADFPSAASDAEAFAKSMMVQQDQDKKNIDRLKSASQRNQELINKNDELDQSQARSIDDIQREINKVEKDNDSLTQMVQQMSRANAELQSTLDRMKQKKPVAEPAVTPATKPQVGVSVATDKIPSQATVGGEPAEVLPASPIDIGARQKINDLSKSVTGALLQLKDKEQAQGLTSAEQERLEKLEKRLAQIEKAQSVFKVFKTKQAKKEKQAGDAAIGAIAKAMGGDTTSADVKAVDPTNIRPAPTDTSGEKKSNVLQYKQREREPDVVKDLVVGQTSDQPTNAQPEADLLGQQFGEDLTHGLEEGSVFGQQDFDTQMDLAKMKADLAREKPAQTAPQSTAPAQPQPVAYKSPERLSDLQARHQKVEALFNLKKKIEAKKATATAGGRILPRGLAADLEDYYSMDDIDTHYDQMLAAYQKQLKAIEQYLGMKKILNKKVTHEMRANELQETKESPAWEEGGREGYYSRPNKNPYKPGTQEHSDYNRGYEQFKGDKDWDVPKRPMREGDVTDASDLDHLKELLAVLSIPVGIMTAAVYSRVKNALDKYNANQIMRALDKKDVVLSREDVQKLRSLLEIFDRAIQRNDGGNAKRIAQDIRELAAKSKIAEDTKSEFKAAAVAKIKKALRNPKLDPDTRKDYETRLQKIQDLEEAKWRKETPWTKSSGKDPRGEVTHMSDVARRETERREREDSPMNQLFKDFEKVFGKKPPVKEGDVVNINRGGYNQFRDKNDFLDKRDYVQKQLLDPRQRENYAELKQRLLDINYAGRKLGYI